MTPLTPRELDHILAALRLWQMTICEGEQFDWQRVEAIKGIVGHPMTAKQIDRLCERLNA